MSPGALEPPAVDPRTAAVAALMVANFVGDELARRRFIPLVGAKLFDVNALEDLPVAARFVLRVLPKLGDELDKRDLTPKASLLATVRATKDEMLRLVERHLGDTDEAHGRIITIRLGEGSADDVHDLRMLADLWRDYAETLEVEAGPTFRREAEREARELATHLELALLGPLSEEDEEWRSYLHRSLAMLVPLYEEVCRAGRFLFHDQKPEARFPTLASVARVRRRLKRETSRRIESQSAMPAVGPPRSSRPASKSIPPEISLVDVSDDDEAALAHAMSSIPPNPPSVAVAAAAPLPSPVPPPPGRPISDPFAGMATSRVPSVEPGPFLDPFASLAGSPVPPPPRAPLLDDAEVLRFDPIDVERLDFSPTVSAGEDADGDLGTADLDLELTYASESNFYSDLVGGNLGLFVATFVVKQPGTPIAVRLSLPQLDEPIFVSGAVHWVREFSPSIEAPPGMGVALKPLAPKHMQAAEAFMKVRAPLLHDD